MLVARERKIYRNFILSTGLVTALVLSVIFSIWLSARGSL